MHIFACRKAACIALVISALRAELKLLILMPGWCLLVDASFGDLLCCFDNAAHCRLEGLCRLRGGGQDLRCVELYSRPHDTRRTGS